MPPPTAKLRLLLLLPIIPALPVIDHPIRFLDGPSFQTDYGGGRIVITHVHANDAIGPSSEVIADPVSGDSYYRDFGRMQDWRNRLPSRSFQLLGIGYSSNIKVQYGVSFFTTFFRATSRR